MADTTVETIKIDINVSSESAEQRIRRLENALAKLKKERSDASRGSSDEFSSVGRSAGSAKKKVAGLSSAFSDLRRIASKGIGFTTKTLAWPILQASKATASLANNFTKAITSLPAAPFKAIGNSLKGIGGRISKLFASIKRIAFYRLIRTAIKAFTQGLKEGIQNLYQFSAIAGTRFKSSMDMMATAALYMKNSLATIAEPLINKLAPAIDLISDKFAALSATIAEFFAALTGQTQYTRAIKYPTEWADAASDAAKATRAWLGPFDEINRLDDNSGYGSGSGLDYSKMFEEIAVNQDGLIAKFAEKLKEAFENGDFTEIGSIIARKLKNALDDIDWNVLKEKARKIGSSIGTFITGFFTEDGFAKSIGKSIAEAINTGIEFFTRLKNTLNFAALGRALGEGIQDFINNLNLDGFTDTLFGSVVGILDFFINANNGINWGGLGDKIKGALDRIPWGEIKARLSELGQSIGSSVTGFLTADGFIESIGTSLANAINSGIDFFYNLKGSIDFEKIGSALGEGIRGLVENFDFGKFVGTVVGFGKGIVDFLSNAISSFGSGSSKEKYMEEILPDGSVIIKRMDKAVTNESGWSLLGRRIGEAIKGVKWEEVFLSIGGFAKEVIGGMFEALISLCDSGGLKKFADDLGQSIGEMIKGINWVELFTNVLKIGVTIVDALGTAIGSAFSGFTGASDGVGKAVGSVATVALTGSAIAKLLGFGGAIAKGASLTSAGVLTLPLLIKFALGAAALQLIGVKNGSDGVMKDVEKEISEAQSVLDGTYGKSLGMGSFKSELEKELDEAQRVIDSWGKNTKDSVSNTMTDVKDTVGGALSSLSEKSADTRSDIEKAFDLGSFIDLEKTISSVKDVVSRAMFGMAESIRSCSSSADSNLATLSRNALQRANEIASAYRNIESASSTGTGVSRMNNNYEAKSRRPVQAYANGGFVNQGQMFIAREAGPELVGSLGNRTAVANNDQIVAGISAGVEEANTEVVNAVYAVANQIIGAIRENKGGGVNWDAVSRKITLTQRRQAAAANV